MNIEELFGFLIKDYGLSYCQQVFRNCYGGNWTVKTYSFYNASGCFTIHDLLQKDELSIYYASEFSTVREALCQKEVDILSIGSEIWEKRSKIGGFRRPFFWWSKVRVMRTFAEALKFHLSHDQAFFGIAVSGTVK